MLFLKNKKNFLNGLIAAGCFMLIIVTLMMLHEYDFIISSYFAASHLFILLAGLLLSEQIFQYYTPRGNNKWLIFILPFVLTLLLVFPADTLYAYSGKMFDAYDNLLSITLYIRLFCIWIILSAYSFILVINAQLEDELLLKEKAAEIEKSSKEAELYHLKQQLQPHFLFNSLNSINSLCITAPEKAAEMVTLLADFLRNTIQKSGENSISIQDEINYLNQYLSIEHIRFGHRLSVKFNQNVENQSFKLPQLMIQPLLENAIKFGLYGSTGMVEIKIDIQSKAEMLYVKITNPYEGQHSQKSKSGFGLEAVRRRLYLEFGINDLLKLEEKEQQFIAQLTLPLEK